MHYIVGLGNPGAKYVGTRHNVGQDILERFVEHAHLPAFHSAARFPGQLSEGVYHDEEVAILLPDTYMNHSGSAVRKLVPKGDETKLVLIYDDIDIPIGEVKISVGRGSGGHNGVQSVINALGTKDFVRVRVGIAPKQFWTGAVKRPAPERMAKFVLGAFTRREQTHVAQLSKQLGEMLSTIMKEGAPAAMNRFNSK